MLQVHDEILGNNCNTACLRCVAGTCLFAPSSIVDCPRVREYMRAIYDLSLPSEMGCTVQEFLEDDRLSILVWKHIIRFRFDNISYDAFESVIKYMGQVD